MPWYEMLINDNLTWIKCSEPESSLNVGNFKTWSHAIFSTKYKEQFWTEFQGSGFSRKYNFTSALNFSFQLKMNERNFYFAKMIVRATFAGAWKESERQKFDNKWPLTIIVEP